MRARDAASCVLLALATQTGCLRTTVFECASADDCADAGVLGRCEPTGFCSFPDESCPSQQRYGDHAGEGLGGACVPVDDGTTSVADTGSDPSAATTTPSTSQSSTDDTTPLSVGSDSSGGPSVTGSTTGESTTVVPDESSSTGSSTSGAVEPQCPSFVDDFEDGIIDPTWTLMDGAYVSEADGELTFEVTPELDQVYPGVVLTDQELASGEVRIHVGQPPATGFERLYLAIAIDPAFSDVVYLMIEGPVLTMTHEVNGMFTPYGTTPYDATAHQWLQIRGADDLLHFEVSSDGESFETLDSVAPPFPLSGVTVVVAATNFALLQATAFVSVAHFELCEG